MANKGFICYDTYLTRTAKLSDQELGRLFRALMKYHANGEAADLTGRESIAFDFIREDVDAADEAYKQKCETNRQSRLNGRQQTITNDDGRQRTSTNVNERPIKEKEKEKEKEKQLSPLRERFERFWTAYPRKAGKGAAEKAWNSLKPDEALLQSMLTAITAQKSSSQWQRDNGQYIPYPATWLNQKRWEDEATQPQAIVYAGNDDYGGDLFLTDAFTQALLNAVPELTPEPGDYEQDGLLYCGKCHTPRQTRLEAPGTPLDGRTVIIPCRCRQAIYDAETAQKKVYAQHEKVLAHNRQMIEAGIAEPFPSGAFADSDSDGKAVQVAQRYADGFEEHAYPGNHGLMLYGPPGTGKTFLAGCIANALTARDSHVLYTTIRKLTTAANRDFGADAELVQLEVQRCSLLILDDFGVERDTEFSWEQTERIINWRYEAGHPLLITTNLSPQEMQGGDITRQRVFDRVHDMCISIPVLGESRRKQHAAQKMQQARAWLLGG